MAEQFPDDSTVVVTGASTGIGRACAEELAKRGAHVVICARGEKLLAEARKALSGEHFGVTAVKADVSREDDVGRLFASLPEGRRLIGVVHAAAVLGPIGEATEISADEWLDTIRVNLFGTFLVLREASRLLIAQGQGGSLVAFSGGGASTPFPRYSAYAASKVAVVRFTETLAQEVAAHRIRVNCLAPGFVATRMHEGTLAAGAAAGSEYLERTLRDLAKGGVPATLAARAAAFLLSDAAAGITGRFVAAPHDGWAEWPRHLGEMEGSDVFTLRRIVPRDRGMDWQ